MRCYGRQDGGFVLSNAATYDATDTTDTDVRV